MNTGKIVALVAFLFAAQPAFTKVVKPAKGQGIFAIMKQEGCKIGWLSQVLNDTKIPASKMNYVRRDQAVIIPDNCNERPPEDSTRQTQAILQGKRDTYEALLHNEVRGLKEELDKLKEKLAQKEKELKSRQAAVLADGKKEKSSSAPFPWVDLAIALLGYAAAALILSQWPRYVVIPKKITKKRLGQKHVFTFHSWIDGEAFYKCPSCTECRLMEKNLDRHLDRCQGAQTPDNTQTQKVNAA